MARIKIKELPVTTYSDIKDTDIIVIENKEDTFQASITDMKKVFSCDNKLSSIVDSINSQLKQIEDIINNNYSTISKNMQDIEDEIVVIQNNVKSILSRLKTAEGKISDHEERVVYLEKSNESVLKKIDDIESVDETQNENLDSLNSDNKTNKDNIISLQDETAKNKDHLKNIDSTLEEYKDIIDKNKEDTDNTAKENFEFLNSRIEEKYMELLDIIDFYHHITHDENGNLVEDKNAIKSYPVGSEFRTTSNEDPSGYFGGEWEKIGTGTRKVNFSEVNDSGEITKTYTYTTNIWIRKS